MMPISEDDLHAYLDDALDDARRHAVETHLAGHPDDARRLAAYREQKVALRTLFAPILDEPVPDALRALSVQPLPGTVDRKIPRKRKIAWPLQAAAGVLLALLGGLGGWLAHERYAAPTMLAQGTALPRQAAIAHAVYSPDARRPVEIAGDQEELLVKWLSKRLGTAVRVPKLGSLGYELVGGRLLPGNSGPVAQFMYQDGAGQRMTLYVTTERPDKAETGFRFAREGAVNVFYWIDGQFGYALSAGIDKGALAHIATTVYDQLESAGPRP